MGSFTGALEQFGTALEPLSSSQSWATARVQLPVKLAAMVKPGLASPSGCGSPSKRDPSRRCDLFAGTCGSTRAKSPMACADGQMTRID
ncbi:hypothetical protein HaLaN_28584, partial [Haematococcus lacustris]